MNNINVGDVCIIVYMDRYPELVWSECIVRLPDGDKKVRLRSGELIHQIGFGVEVPGWVNKVPGTLPLLCAPRAWLRKKKPDDEEQGPVERQRVEETDEEVVGAKRVLSSASGSIRTNTLSCKRQLVSLVRHSPLPALTAQVTVTTANTCCQCSH